jgi:prefoldin subunit 5
MTNEEKARKYTQLMSQFDVLRNRIADIRLTQVNLTESQENDIKNIERQQQKVLFELNRLLK